MFSIERTSKTIKCSSDTNTEKHLSLGSSTAGASTETARSPGAWERRDRGGLAPGKKRQWRRSCSQIEDTDDGRARRQTATSSRARAAAFAPGRPRPTRQGSSTCSMPLSREGREDRRCASLAPKSKRGGKIKIKKQRRVEQDGLETHNPSRSPPGKRAATHRREEENRPRLASLPLLFIMRPKGSTKLMRSYTQYMFAKHLYKGQLERKKEKEEEASPPSLQARMLFFSSSLLFRSPRAHSGSLNSEKK